MNKSVFLYVRGDDYSALTFDQNFNAQEIYEDMVRNGESSRTIDGEYYMDIDIEEFEKIDTRFVKWIKNNLCDYDQLKGSDIFEVKPVK
ncbi:hypothetical protein G9G63_09120 [Paenibacillus sp. EKM202P]|uniref:hypothetical protein n=1 Tax=unclassified Paenibacillus TaxID=185978 RepID=UPI0013EB66DF|nr:MULTISPECIES: hypothetical protein [unclassified Paenibacillus]KAF6565310.1 hypothetical protein G9G63_09120 [Paenibacillus sp. EKM202P]KAF6569364.1 hypothetical protein G9G64_12970 [Paenibacillus sp. EKM207P]